MRLLRAACWLMIGAQCAIVCMWPFGLTSLANAIVAVPLALWFYWLNCRFAAREEPVDPTHIYVEGEDEDPLLGEVVRRAWESGKPIEGRRNEDGTTTVREV